MEHMRIKTGIPLLREVTLANIIYFLAEAEMDGLLSKEEARDEVREVMKILKEHLVSKVSSKKARKKK